MNKLAVSKGTDKLKSLLDHHPTYSFPFKSHTSSTLYAFLENNCGLCIYNHSFIHIVPSQVVVLSPKPMEGMLTYLDAITGKHYCKQEQKPNRHQQQFTFGIEVSNRATLLLIPWSCFSLK